MPAMCRDCAAPLERPPAGGRCPACASPRLIAHDELDLLTIGHIDCDAFYASVEKRDNPDLIDKPVIVGGSKRGVVAACCYIARIRGIHSAMPMFQARKLCPDAVIIKPDMNKYRIASRRIRALMDETTPQIEPLSLDEAFLDLSGTRSVNGGSPARTLARLVRRIEKEVGVTASIGLSYNKFLAKVASDLDKPRGFAIIGRGDAAAFLENRPVGLMWGVGKSLGHRLRNDGITTIGQLRAIDEATLTARYGAIGHRLALFARGEDDRAVETDAPTKSISAETTLDKDIDDPDILKAELWRLSEKVAARLKAAGLAGSVVVLKLKTSRFRLLTRRRSIADPTRLAEVLYRTALPMLEKEAVGRKFRLIGIGAGNLTGAAFADSPDLLDGEREHQARIEQAMDSVRDRFGASAIAKGLGWRRQ